MKRAGIAILLQMGLFLPAAVAQTSPVLRQRGPDSQSPPAHVAKGVSTVPDTALGEYALDEDGSVVQITIERNRLSGYVTEMEHGTALTLLFDSTTVDGNRLFFTTRPVHGVRYSFAGAIVRGDATDRAQSGFYRLVGDWTTYRDAERMTKRVSLKSTPRPQ
jgi:hypothetical protein